MEKRLLCILMVLALCVTMMPLTTFADDSSGTEVTASDTSDDILWDSAGQSTSYVVNGDVTIKGRINVKGEVTLILTAGHTLTAEQGIYVGAGNRLTITGTGTLIAGSENGTPDNCAGIGGNTKENCGTIIIDGGTVEAVGGAGAAGIGGGGSDHATGIPNATGGGDITINGGNVTATGGKNAANGGGGAGIGGGFYGNGGSVTISGGMVTAVGKEGGAGIGTGPIGDGYHITISGVSTVVNATGQYAAGIGGGFCGNGGSITIENGTVTAEGSTGGAGIGSGPASNDGAYEVTISGGKVNATGHGYGAGIGGGAMVDGGETTISGGDVTAVSDYGAGIGGGGTSAGNVSASGSTTFENGVKTHYTYSTSGTHTSNGDIEISKNAGGAVKEYTYDTDGKLILTISHGTDVSLSVSDLKDVNKLVIAHGVTVKIDAELLKKLYDSKIKVENNGILIFKDCAEDDAQALKEQITGTGVVEVSASDGKYDGTEFSNSGVELTVYDITPATSGSETSLSQDRSDGLGNSWEASSNTLTLSDIHMKGKLVASGDVTIVVSGSVIIDSIACGGNLTIKGKSSDASLNVGPITCDNLTITDVHVVADSVSLTGVLSLNGSAVLDIGTYISFDDEQNAKAAAQNYIAAAVTLKESDHSHDGNMGHCIHCPVTLEIQPVKSDSSSAATSDRGGGGAGTSSYKPYKLTQSGQVTTLDVSESTVRKDDQTTATISQSTADTLFVVASANKSTEIVIVAKPEGDTDIRISEVVVPTETVKKLAEQISANVTIRTDVAEVKLDNSVYRAIANEAAGETIAFTAEKTVDDSNVMYVELKAVSGEKTLADFDGGNATVTVPLPETLAKVENLACLYVGEDGAYTSVSGAKNGEDAFTFAAGDWGTYAVVSKTKATQILREQKLAAIKAGVKKTTIKVSAKAAKSGITVKWSKSKGYKVDGYQIYRSTKKSSGYKKIATTTNRKYKDKRSLKSGKKYYYKVRGYRKVNGKTVYTRWSKVICRTAK